ncbi:MAG: S8 family serine peptidase [Bacteroidetes bacterium]|nr:S8 family serine peptidase [Bacteroidota bacterium]
MKLMNVLKFFLALVLVVGFAASCNKDSDLATDVINSPTESSKLVSFKKSEPIPGQYIVVFKNDEIGERALKGSSYKERLAMMREKAEGVFNSLRIETSKIDRTYGTAIKGFSVINFTDEEVKALSSHPEIEYLEQDQTISIQGGPPGGGGGGGGGGGQETPWGITRVNGVSNYGGSGRAWIIDTGIDLDHPDLNVSPAAPAGLSESFLGSGPPSNASPDDQNGHGSHVSGTIAAINNSIGVIGVAPGALVIAVRVLDKNGSGSTSGVIAGVDYVGAHATSGDVANMSLGGGVSTTLDNAVINASNPCKFALAAGNESDNANNHSPARANGNFIWTVSAMSQGDNWASFSNYGNPPVDYCAPGVSVKSCWKNGGYNTISGTSMATPHVAGVLLLGSISSSGTVNGDPDGNPDPIASH